MHYYCFLCDWFIDSLTVPLRNKQVHKVFLFQKATSSPYDPLFPEDIINL